MDRSVGILVGATIFASCGPAPAPVAEGQPPWADLVLSAEVIAPGTEIECDASASGDPEAHALTYDWDFGDATTLVDGPPRTRHRFDAAGHFIVQIRVTDAEGLSDLAFVEVVVAEDTEIPPLLITQHPESTAVDPGKDATFDVRVTGGLAPTLQWRKDGIPILGEAAATLTLPSVAESHEGLYDCVIRDGDAVLPTRAGRLTVNDAPRIVLQPATQLSTPGGSVVFSVFAQGAAPLSYQWRKDGADLSSATQSELAIHPVALTDAGTYQVVVSNSAGRVSSDVATLTVPAPTPDPDPPPVITSRPITAASLAQPYSYSIVTTGAAPITVEVVGLPASLRFDGTNTIAGTPAIADVGVHPIVITATNHVAATEQRFALEVTALLPTITSVPNPTARVGRLYSYRVVATGNPAPTIRVTGLPSSLAFDGVDTIAGTATTADVGVHPVVVTASSPLGDVNQAFDLEILEGTFSMYENFADTSVGARPGWRVTGEWEFGVPPQGGGPVASTKLSSNYGDRTHSLLDTPAYDLRSLPTPKLRILHWYDTEADYDGGRIAISTDGGATFSPIAASHFESGAYDATIRSDAQSPLAGEPVWAGRINGFTEARVDLDAALGPSPRDEVVIRFEFASDANTTDLGWSIAWVHIGDGAPPRP